MENISIISQQMEIQNCRTIIDVYNKKRIGPKTEPCETPQEILNTSDLQTPKETNCFLFIK